MKKVLLVFALCLFSILEGFSQNGIIGSGFATMDFSTTDCFTDGAGGTRKFEVAPNGTGFQYFRMVRCWDGDFTQFSPNTDCSGGGDEQIVFGNTVNPPGTCTNKAYFIDVSSLTNTYVFKTPGGPSPNLSFTVFEIQGAVESITSVSEPAGTVNANTPYTVNATASGNINAGQGVYLRYTTDNFSTSTVIEMQPSSNARNENTSRQLNTSFQAEIPGQSSGTEVIYYVFTSGEGLSISGSNADFMTINLNSGSGSNYMYAVGSTVPVRLAYFNLNQKGSSAILRWEALAEINHDYYTIDSSRDGKQWNEVAKIFNNSYRASENNLFYEIRASILPGITYFRLSQTDQDGSITNLGVRSAQLQMQVEIAPNPASDLLFVKLVNELPSGELRVHDLTGKTILTESILGEKDSILDVNISHLKRGLYIINILDQNNMLISTKKLLVN